MKALLLALGGHCLVKLLGSELSVVSYDWQEGSPVRWRFQHLPRYLLDMLVDRDQTNLVTTS